MLSETGLARLKAKRAAEMAALFGHHNFREALKLFS